jgi:hypothetical protein
VSENSAQIGLRTGCSGINFLEQWFESQQTGESMKQKTAKSKKPQVRVRDLKPAKDARGGNKMKSDGGFK